MTYTNKIASFFDERVLLHTHVEKAAGTTLTYGLAEIVGWARTIDTRLTPDLRSDRLSAAALQHTWLYSGHHHYGVHVRFEGRTPLYIAAVRPPMERLVSYYRYTVNAPKHPAWRHIGDLDFPSAVCKFVEIDHAIVSGGQTRMLMGRHRIDDLTHEEILDHLNERYWLIVPYRQVNRALVMIRKAFGLPPIQRSSLNVGKGPQVEIDPGVVAMLRERMKADQAIVRWAQDSFEDNIGRAVESIRRRM